MKLISSSKENWPYVYHIFLVTFSGGYSLQYQICSDNQFYNILRLFDVLPDFPFTTSEAIGDYYL